MFLVNCYYHVVVFCTCDINCMSLHPWKKVLSSVILPEVSYFPCLGFFKFFSHWVRVSTGSVSSPYSFTNVLFVHLNPQSCALFNLEDSPMSHLLLNFPSHSWAIIDNHSFLG